MNTFTEEPTIPADQACPWTVEYRDAEGGNPVRISVEAASREQAINNASAQLNTPAIVKPARVLYFHSATRL